MICFCLASGPSMRAEDVEAIRGLGHVIAINNTVFLAPWADVLYSCDRAWWLAYADQIADFKGRRVALAQDGLPDCVEGMPWSYASGLGLDCIHTGNNSGYQAINLAYLMGAKKIVLLGYDMQHPGKHWHPPHPAPLGNFSRGMPELCIPKFKALADYLQAQGIEVINATRETALTCFKRSTLAEALGAL